MTDRTSDALALGQRIVAVLETGRRTATYKLATLMALVDHCVEHRPEDPRDRLDIPIRALADRVIDLYWRQVLPLHGFGELRQSSNQQARIPAAVLSLRAAARKQTVSFELARERAPAAYERAVGAVALTLVQQPLHRLQRLPGEQGRRAFLYDDSWMHDHVSASEMARQGATITLFPFVAADLARLAGLLKPTLEILWVQDVMRMNASLREDSVDLTAHLFGRGRVPLGRVRTAYFEEFGAHCFYCNRGLSSWDPVDHLLPWSRVGIDGLANLVTACRGCNASKSGSLPAVGLVTLALARPVAVLDRLGREIEWPVQRERTGLAARGLFLSSPAGTPLWQGRNAFAAVDTFDLGSLDVRYDAS